MRLKPVVHTVLWHVMDEFVDICTTSSWLVAPVGKGAICIHTQFRFIQ